MSGSISYIDFANVILEFENEKVLTRVKSHGENGKNPSLAFSYRINKSALLGDIQETIKLARLALHPAIYIESYFQLPEEVWERDFCYIQKVDQYIKTFNLPTESVPAPERSYELVEDEKWITEGGGEEVLHRIKLWNKLLILPVSDPLMLAFNPLLMHKNEHLHLIVENKTTYQALLPALSDSGFTSLIYGCGKKIIKSIEHFHYQLPLEASDHVFYYFGDLDHEGITIWNSLSRKIKVTPALAFYLECLKRPYAYGKQNQRPNIETLSFFLPHFQNNEQEQIQNLLQEGGYYPQEILKTKELQDIWRNASWK
ncbi:Wadjet anti-phage system protein JetD domain-containing protein [Bacillus sp. DJP31]|uniref:Wadjet anti-phage system protein JetD domain-containing protein n=1 Tax=Bacillus sp. DJP31 TaxID=3409789 RepID=UPI003BB7D294